MDCEQQAPKYEHQLWWNSSVHFENFVVKFQHLRSCLVTHFGRQFAQHGVSQQLRAIIVKKEGQDILLVVAGRDVALHHGYAEKPIVRRYNRELAPTLHTKNSIQSYGEVLVRTGGISTSKVYRFDLA